MNATKLNKVLPPRVYSVCTPILTPAAVLPQVFAKPFVHAFDGHRDGISALAINKKSLRSFVSGAHNGEVSGNFGLDSKPQPQIQFTTCPRE